MTSSSNALPAKAPRAKKTPEVGADAKPTSRGAGAKPTPAQRRYLARGLDQPGGKLPLFDTDGQEVPRRTIEACLAAGWAERWLDNPIKPDWLVCRLTDAGRRAMTD
jgi:hypothetical protein